MASNAPDSLSNVAQGKRRQYFQRVTHEHTSQVYPPDPPTPETGALPIRRDFMDEDKSPLGFLIAFLLIILLVDPGIFVEYWKNAVGVGEWLWNRYSGELAFGTWPFVACLWYWRVLATLPE